MNLNRRHILLFAGIVLLCFLAGLIFFQPREPRYQGRPLSNWLEDMSKARVGFVPQGVSIPLSTADLEGDAVYAVQQMGAEAYPFLVEMVRSVDGPVRRTILQKLGQERAGKLGMISANEKHFRARLALFRLGTNAAGVWVQILLDRSFPLDLRLASASYCSGLPQEASRTIPAMLQLMAQVKKEDQETIRWGISRFELEVSLPVLLRHLQSPDSQLQLAAIQTLKTLGRKARNAIPALEQQLTSSVEEVGLAAADTLLGLDAHHVPAIVYRMHHGEVGVRSGAYWMFTREEEDAAKAVPELMRGLTDGEAEIRKAAAESLAKYGAGARVALPGLTNLMGDAKRFVRLAASNAVERISGNKGDF